jgi:hypothetical protein
MQVGISHLKVTVMNDLSSSLSNVLIANLRVTAIVSLLLGRYGKI